MFFRASLIMDIHILLWIQCVRDDNIHKYYNINNRNNNAMSTKIKELDLSKKGFTANGKNYIYSSSISTDHFYKMKEFELEVALDRDVKGLTDEISKAYQSLNSRKDADAAVTLYNILKSLGGSSDRHMPILKLCSCFIFEENEDPRFYNENNMNTKIEDWNEEGISIVSFFRLAANTGTGLKEILKENFQDSSQEKKKV